jgi:hypothetical protein
MPKLIAWLLSGLLLSTVAFSQSGQVTGRIADTAEKKNLANSSILLLRKTDSIMVRHARSGAAGDFKLTRIPGGHYLILVTYPNYADYVDTLEVDSGGIVHLPVIGLVLKSKLLQEVVVSANKGGMRIKGDTTEFSADSFHTQANANVEDLLKKLPGIQVDRNGQITAEGQTVKKVLVDGEEFFGDDPTLVTQNLRADMVDKVQVFDKKSDQAIFTGIDDGQRDKTINLKLKDSKKNGYFGRVTGSAGTDGYYDEELMANYFKKKMKVAAYGILSNTGKTGLNWQDRDTYGQSFASNLDVDENTGSISFTGVAGNDDLDDWNGQYSGQGFPKVKTGGLHYNNKWNDDAMSLNGNYKYMDLTLHGSNATNSENILPDTVFYNNSSQKFNREIIRQNFSGVYEWKFDSTSSIKFSADGGNDHKNNSEADSSQALASDSGLVNQSIRTINTVSDNRGYNSNLLWRKKLGKVGRTLSLNVRENYSDKTESGYLFSNTEFFAGGPVPYKDSVVDQYNKYLTTNLMLDSRLTYTEPIGKGSFLGIDYGATVNNTHSDRNSYNKDGLGKYDTFDSVYSNNYQFNILTHRAGLSYTLIRKKFRLTAANDVAFSTYRQKDLNADTAVRRSFVNWYPNATMSYQFAAQTRLFIRYYGSTNAPTLQQLQPILSNENPLNVIIGNPGLKPSFQNGFNVGYNSYHILTEQSIYASVGYNFTINAISNSLTYDTTGKQTTQAVNVSGNHSFRANIGYGFKLKGIGLNMNINGSANSSNNITVVNNFTNLTKSANYTFGLGFWKSKEKKYELNLNGNVTYTTSKSSDDPALATHYYTLSIDPGADIFLPWHFQVHGDANMNIRQKTPVFSTNNDVFLVNGWIGKKLLKGDQLLIKAAVNDLLNQNTGFNRNVSSSFITQNTYTTIKRYFLFSVVWNFTKAGIPIPNRGN